MGRREMERRRRDGRGRKGREGREGKERERSKCRVLPPTFKVI